MTPFRLGRDGFIKHGQGFVLGGQVGVNHRQHEQGEQGADAEAGADDEADVEFNAQHALSTVRVDAIVGMHTSSVRNIIKKVAYSKVPYVYTPLYEGGETTPGVYAIGETPDKQLRPAIRLLTERYRARRWMLIGNDYIWPRKSHALAKAYLAESGAEVISEHYLHIGQGPGRQNFY